MLKLTFKQPHLMRAGFIAMFLCLCMHWSGAAPLGVNGQETLLLSYVQKQDRSFDFLWQRTELSESSHLYTLHVTSQTWQGLLWKHQLNIWVPERPRNTETALLLLSHLPNTNIGYPMGSGLAAQFDEQFARYVANELGIVVAVLGQVPNQPLFGGLSEDTLMRYTFERFLRSGDNDWPIVFPMVKSAVRGMDAVQSFLGDRRGWSPKSFILSGQSKRGQVTWLTAAVDKRVGGIVPRVFDFLNSQPQLSHQQDSLDGPSRTMDSFGDIAAALNTPRGLELNSAVDPFTYRDRYTIPKLLLMGTNDPYWTLDATRFYYDALPGKKNLFYVPGAGHGFDFNAVAPVLGRFIDGLFQDRPLPAISWRFADESNVIVEWSSQDPVEILIWEARTTTRDFRNAKWTGRSVRATGATSITVSLPPPETGFQGQYVEVKFRDGPGAPVFGVCSRPFITGKGLSLEGKRDASASQSGAGFERRSELLPFGAQLFQGRFAGKSRASFNPDYLVGMGDEIHFRMWGTLEKDFLSKVDEQGNVVILGLGRLPLLGVKNSELNQVVGDYVRKTYTGELEVYAVLESPQPVKILVSGYVVSPGIYAGTATDSALSFLDLAGGIDLRRGSFIDVSVMRGSQKIASVDLYNFLQTGALPPNQLRDGDVILVGPRQNIASITGEVHNPTTVELGHEEVRLRDFLRYASPRKEATHVSLRSVRSGRVTTSILELSEALDRLITPNDFVEVLSRNLRETTMVGIDGEHAGATRIVLPKGSSISDAIRQIEPTAQSNLKALQIFRPSVARRQRDLLFASLANLEKSVSEPRSETSADSDMQRTESEIIRRFIERARQVEPTGRIVLESSQDTTRVQLEEGDVLFVPTISTTISVQGAVNFPNVQIHHAGDGLGDYIARAGGFAPEANRMKIILRKASGVIEPAGSGNLNPDPGDEIVVLPEPNRKLLSSAKAISDILYQVAVSTDLVLSL